MPSRSWHVTQLQHTTSNAFLRLPIYLAEPRMLITMNIVQVTTKLLDVQTTSATVADARSLQD